MRVQGRRGRFRRLRCAAEVGGAREARARPVSDRHRRRGRGGQYRRASAPGADQAHRAAARRHLSRQDPELVRIRRSRRSIPDLKLPDAKIAVVHRSDGSGTTYNFTNYLSKVSPQWREKVGVDTAGDSGRPAPAPRATSGVAQAVRQTKNSIGYVEYAHAVQTKLSFALVRNRAGRFVRPDAASFAAAAERGLGQRQRFRPDADRRARRRRLSDRRHRVRADAQAARRRGARRRRSISSNGRWTRARRTPPSSATCRCRTIWSSGEGEYWRAFGATM